MILLDANLLIYAVNRDAPLHRKAKAWLESVISGSETVALSWNVILAFLRLTTRAGLFRTPLPVEVAFGVVEAWLSQPSVAIVQPGLAPPAVPARFARALRHGRQSDLRRPPCRARHRA